MPKSNEDQVAPREAFRQFEERQNGTVDIPSTAKKAPAKAARVSKAKSEVRFPEPKSKHR